MKISGLKEKPIFKKHSKELWYNENQSTLIYFIVLQCAYDYSPLEYDFLIKD